MAGRGKFPDTKWKKLKESAMTYFKRNNATQELEALLNKLALVKPDDLYGYMVRYPQSYTFHICNGCPFSLSLMIEQVKSTGGF